MMDADAAFAMAGQELAQAEREVELAVMRMEEAHRAFVRASARRRIASPTPVVLVPIGAATNPAAAPPDLKPGLGKHSKR
jgi:hypothetical protein